MATSQPFIVSKDNAHVELTHTNLDPIYIMNKVKSPQAGAIVLFAGMKSLSLSCTTRSDLRSQARLETTLQASR